MGAAFELYLIVDEYLTNMIVFRKPQLPGSSRMEVLTRGA